MSAGLFLLLAYCVQLVETFNASDEIRPVRRTHSHSLLKQNCTGGARRAKNWARFRSTFAACPRCPRLRAGALSLDFEIEPGAFLQMTPALLLERGAFKLSQRHAVKYPHVSDDFDVGLEGTAMPRGLRFKGTLMGLGAQIEITTKPKRPLQAFSLIEPLQQYLQSLGEDVNGRLLPGSDRITYNGGFLRQQLSTDQWRYCPMHWTVGLDLPSVPKLLEWTNHPVHGRVQELCGDRSPEYQAVVALGAMVLQQAHDCAIRCTKPKICMRPWLVRTHFGDMVKRVRQIEGEERAQNLPQDVLQVSGQDRDTPLFSGFRDYTTFLEMAQLGGLVQTPSFGENNEVGSNGEVELGSEDELMDLAQQMLTSKEDVQRRLSERPCTVHGPDAEAFEQVTAGAWLDGMLEGKDMMSDSDSPISQAGSFSHLVWKSMGAWRMQDGDARVYLECRRPRHCLPMHPARDRSILAEMRYVATSLDSFEHAQLVESGVAESLMNATKDGSSGRHQADAHSSKHHRGGRANITDADNRGTSTDGHPDAPSSEAGDSQSNEDDEPDFEDGPRVHVATPHRPHPAHGGLHEQRQKKHKHRRLSSHARKHAFSKRQADD